MRRFAFFLFLVIVAGLAAGTSLAAHDGKPVEVYSAEWCPACKEAKAFLEDNGVAYVEHDVEKDREALREMRKSNPSGMIPFAIIHGDHFIGFDPETYREALGLPAK